MTTTPTPVSTIDQTASKSVATVDTLIQDGVAVAETAIIAADPVMATPLLKQIWETALEKLVSWVLEPLVNTLTGKIIVDAQEYFDLKAAVSAQTALDQAAQKGDLNAQAQAQAVLDSAVAKAAQYIGAVVPS